MAAQVTVVVFLTQAEKLNILMSSFKAIKPHVCHFVWTLKMKCTKMECH